MNMGYDRRPTPWNRQFVRTSGEAINTQLLMRARSIYVKVCSAKDKDTVLATTVAAESKTEAAETKAVMTESSTDVSLARHRLLFACH